MSQEIGQRNVERLLQFKSDAEAEGRTKMFVHETGRHQGKLKTNEIARICGIHIDAFKPSKGNKEVIRIAELMEEEWAHYVPEPTLNDEKNRANRESDRAMQLQRQVESLQSKLAVLKKQLAQSDQHRAEYLAAMQDFDYGMLEDFK